MHAADVNDDPTLNSFTVTDLPADILGQQVRFKIQAQNLRGSVGTSSDVLAVIIADVPEAPENGPTSDVDLTSPSSIRVVYDEPSNGGS